MNRFANAGPQGGYDHNTTIDALLTPPALVDDALSDCCTQVAVAFAAGQPVEPIIEAAARAYAERECEDAIALSDGETDPLSELVRSWERYQAQKGVYPPTALIEAYDAREPPP